MTVTERVLANTDEAKEKRRGTIAKREEAMIELSDIIRLGQSDMVRVHAAERVLDRLEGKPTQKTQVGGQVTLERGANLPAPSDRSVPVM